MVDHNAALDEGFHRTSPLDEVAARLLTSRLSEVTHGRLRLTLPSGRSVDIGSGGDVDAVLRLNSYALVWRAMRRGLIGFADSYMNQEIETPDLGAVMRFFLANFSAFDNAGGGWFRTRIFDRFGHRRKANTKAGSRRNIAAHYDLGNAFYALWLDPSMTYSSGIYECGSETLAEAQEAKCRLVLEAVAVEPGNQILEIGCGWGSMAERLVEAGGDVTAITVSAAQFEYAHSQIVKRRLGDRADVRFQDYRDVEGEFDRIVSVEMIEAVGEEHWAQYFGQLNERLIPGGHAVIQAITIREESFEAYRRHPDFIQRYIFPGGMLPTVSILKEQAERHELAFESVRRFGQSYARTLRDWRQRFLEVWPEVQALGFDERFRRMWLYYLTYCEVGFETGLIDVGVYRFVRRG
jgi:cyclopropane-fatty-acyl-phospholipid synthase